ncbi:MAG: Hpt domain-containing protein [Vicinamibacterales bacterium]
MSRAGTEVVFDQQEFLERLGGDYELAVEVAQLFLEDCPRRIAVMREAVGMGDATTLRTEAHGLKGAAGNMSAYQLSLTARELEHLASAGRMDDAVEVMSRLAEEADAAIEALRAFEAEAAAG